MVTKYIDIETVKDALFLKTAEQDVIVGLLIDSAMEAVDKHTGQSFLLEASAIRYFDTKKGEFVGIRETASVSLVRVDTTLDGTFDKTIVEGTDFFLYPLNSSPKSLIALRELGTLANFPAGLRTVEVTAPWGYAAVPSLIQQATLMMASRWFKRRDRSYTEITKDGASNVLDPDVIAMLSTFRAGAEGQLEIIFP